MTTTLYGVTILKETASAVLVDIDGEEVWIPQSQIHADSQIWEEGDEGDLVISDWIAKDKGLI